MEKAHIDELKRLQDEAMLRLRAGTQRRGYFGEILALMLPSFEDNCAYEIMRSTRPTTVSVPGRPVNAPVEDGSALAVKTIWRNSTDIEKFSNPVTRLKHGIGVRLQPTIEEVDVNLATEKVTGLLSRAAAMAVPPHAPASAFGCDGTYYELIFGRYFAHSRFGWWEAAPPGWEPLALLLEEIKTLVESTIAAR